MSATPGARRQVRELSVSLADLTPVVTRPSFGSYLRGLWRRRHFILTDARARVLTSHSRTLLGSAWLVLRPVLDVAAYFVIFGLLLRSDRGIENYLGYLIVGVFLFQYTSSSLTSGASSIIQGRALLRAFTFPRAALPIAAVARESFRMGPVLAAMVVLLLVIPPLEVLTWRWLLLVPVLMLQCAMNVGLALIAARVTARVPDLTQVINVAVRFWLYGSAVFFSYERFIDQPVLLGVVQANPMFRVLDIARDCLLYGQTPTASSWLVLAGWALSLLAVGTWFFWRGEERYARG